MSICPKIGKRIFRSEFEAMLALNKAVRRRDEGRRFNEVRCYRCPWCRGWHLASEPRRKGARR
jgi:hypothetical protein